MFNFVSQNQSPKYERETGDTKDSDINYGKKNKSKQLKEKLGTPRRMWLPYEDQLVLKLVERYGLNWKAIAEDMNNIRTSKQIRDRWNNKLDPSLENAQWTREEQNLLLTLFEEHGKKWCKIAKLMPGRSEGMVKNHFYTHFRELLDDPSKVHESVEKIKSAKSSKAGSIFLEKECSDSEYNHLSRFLAPIQKKIKSEPTKNTHTNRYKKDFEFTSLHPQFSINLLERQQKLLDGLSDLEKNVHRTNNLSSLSQGHQTPNNRYSDSISSNIRYNNQVQSDLRASSSLPKVDMREWLNQSGKMESHLDFCDLLNQAPLTVNDAELNENPSSIQKKHLDYLKEYFVSFDHLFPDIQIPDSVPDVGGSASTLTET